MAKIAFFIPPFVHGSGGIRTIAAYADALATKGHTCFLQVEGASPSNKKMLAAISSISKSSNVLVNFGWRSDDTFDLAIATIWYSAEFIHYLVNAPRKAYLVQDFEPYFYPRGDLYLRARNTYQFGLHTITLGRWLQDKIKSECNQLPYLLDFGVDLLTYREITMIKESNSVCFIYQPSKSWRCHELGIKALHIVKRHIPNTKIYLYGSTPLEKQSVPFKHTHLGLISPSKCNELYNRCTVGLCISATNPSRIPFEMMAAGLPAVELKNQNTERDFPSDAIYLCEPSPESLAAGIIKLLLDPSTRAQRRLASIEYMSTRDHLQEANQFCHSVSAILETTNHVHPIKDAITNRESQLKVSTEMRRSFITPPNSWFVNLPPPFQKILLNSKRFTNRASKYIFNQVASLRNRKNLPRGD